MDTTLIQKIRNYFINQPVERVWLFGSYSQGKETEKSDIDLMVEFISGASIGMTYFRIIDDLERISKRRIDLAERSMINPHIRENVEQQKVLIYERAN